MDGGEAAARTRPAAREGATAGDIGSDVLETALGLLAKDEQDAIRMIVCEGKSYQHAAEALGVSVTTINNWKHRGIVKLRKLVGSSMDSSMDSSMAVGRDEIIGLGPRERGRFGRVDLSGDRGAPAQRPSAAAARRHERGLGRVNPTDEVA